MTIRELLAEESPHAAPAAGILFSGLPDETPASPLSCAAGEVVVRQDAPCRCVYVLVEGGPTPPAPARRPLPHLLRVRPPHPLRGVRGPVRGKLLSGRGACQNRLPVLGARPGGLLLLVLLRPGHHPLPGTGGGAQPVGSRPAGSGVTCLWTATAAFSPFLVSWYEANAGGRTACIPMTRPAIGDETGVCSPHGQPRGARPPGAGFLDIQSGKIQLSHPQYLRLRAELERRLADGRAIH